MFNTNNKRHFETYMLTRVSNFTTYDGTTIKNEDKRILNKKENAKIYSILVTFEF